MQVQEYKQTVTTKESQLLIHELISVSIYCITFLRDIFSEDHYIDAKYYNEKKPKPDSNFIRTKKLRSGIDSQTDMLIKCIEEGIKAAIEKQFLKAVQFSIYLSKDHPEQAIESYVFSIDYDTNSLSISSGLSSRFSDSKTSICELQDSDSVIAQIQTMIRKLIVLSQSFDFLPPEKFVSIRLLFNENCPDDYQPQFFQDASMLPAVTLRVDNENQMSDLGEIDTGKNQVKLNVFADSKSAHSVLVVDPFDFIDDGIDNSDASGTCIATDYSNNNEIHVGADVDVDVDVDVEVDVPVSSLHLDSFLDTHKSDAVITQSLRTYTQEQSHCQKCHTSLNPVEYGYDKPIKRPFACYKCMLNDEISSELMLLMKIRSVWHYLLNNGFPDTEKLLQKTGIDVWDAGNAVNAELVRNVFNCLFSQSLLLVTTNVAFKPNSAEFEPGMGEFCPPVEGILDNNGITLTKGKSYNVSFVPQLCKKFYFLTYDKSLDKIYFPNFQMHRIDLVKKTLEKFKALVTTAITVRAPNVGSRNFNSEIADSQPLSGAITMSHRRQSVLNTVKQSPEDQTTRPCQSLEKVRACASPENIVQSLRKRVSSPEATTELSFQDSLGFLSQQLQQSQQDVTFISPVKLDELKCEIEAEKDHTFSVARDGEQWRKRRKISINKKCWQ
ncbi:hypothetical protein PVL30_001365 [Lodderomyces elongisporus]|uniref:uncharacterized protein n=1 Tax=Lodderomyces elongisporus TaxID=36914 RepID=UPI002923A69B|nr:uncharacterized protein PVL30_001365 [Lodderomyces elongisporus]WLF77648.1 hypothetical protein PVL30_001365 [Lodderomyces elongisporus]